MNQGLNAQYLNGYTFNNLEDRYVNVSGDWMDTDAILNFKGKNSSTSVWAKIGFMSTTPNGIKMHLGSDSYNTKGFYIVSSGYDAANDNGGIAIDNDGVTAFGAGDTGSVFRVINEDNQPDGAQFAVHKNAGAYIKYRLSIGQQSINTSYNLYVLGNSYINGEAYFKSQSVAQTINIGYNTATWGGAASSHPMIWSGDGTSYYTMIAMPHIPYLENGINGYTSTAYQGAIVRFASNPAAAAYWDIGLRSTDLFSLSRNGTEFIDIKTNGNVGINTNNPSTTLHVNGNTKTNKLLVSTDSTTALINILYNNFAINFREGRSYDTGFFYGTYGNEFLALTTQQSVTSLIFGNGYDPASITSGSFITGDSTNYTYGASTNVIQIKQNCVNIGDVWKHNVTPTYKLRVNGTSNFTDTGYFEKTLKMAGGYPFYVRSSAEGWNMGIFGEQSGNDCMTFVTDNAVTSFMFCQGQGNLSGWTSGKFNSVTPAMQIKNNSVYINKLLANGVSPSYKLYVEGTSYINDTLSAKRIIINDANVGSDALTVGGCIRITGGPTTSNMNAGLRRIFFGDGTNACLGEGGDGADTDWMYIRGYHKILLETNNGSTTIDINGYPNSPGFIKTGYDNSYVLLAGGGTKAISEFGGNVTVSNSNPGLGKSSTTIATIGGTAITAYVSDSDKVDGLHFVVGTPPSSPDSNTIYIVV